MIGLVLLIEQKLVKILPVEVKLYGIVVGVQERIPFNVMDTNKFGMIVHLLRIPVSTDVINNMMDVRQVIIHVRLEERRFLVLVDKVEQVVLVLVYQKLAKVMEISPEMVSVKLNS